MKYQRLKKTSEKKKVGQQLQKTKGKTTKLRNEHRKQLKKTEKTRPGKSKPAYLLSCNTQKLDF